MGSGHKSSSESIIRQAMAPFALSGSHWLPIRFPIGTKTRSLAFSSTAAFTLCPHLAANSTLGRCTPRALKSTSIILSYGPLNKFGYKDFIPMFQAEHYDPAAWARLFKQAGAKYVVPVFEHHDGFAMYNSDLSDWTAAKMGPHRDLAGDLAIAVRAEGLHLGASSHRIEHDWFMGAGRRIESDLNDPRLAGFYGPSHLQFALDEEADNFLEDWTYVSPEFASDWLARDAEIVEKYHPELFYFDFWIGHPEVRSYLARFAAFFYNETSS